MVLRGAWAPTEEGEEEEGGSATSAVDVAFVDNFEMDDGDVVVDSDGTATTSSVADVASVAANVAAFEAVVDFDVVVVA